MKEHSFPILSYYSQPGEDKEKVKNKIEGERMILQTDTHCHTLSSGHAYSTIGEMAFSAQEKGLKLIAMTDHGPAMPDAPGVTFFRNLRVVPETLHGVEILKGAEVNIMSFQGEMDLSDAVLRELDLVIASLHYPCIKPGSQQENTQALIKAVEHPSVNILGHIGNPLYPIDGEAVIKAVKQHGKLIEINNSSLKPNSFRRGSWENCLGLLKICRDLQVPVVIGSDAHIAGDVGDYQEAEALSIEAALPEELILSTDVKKLKAYLGKADLGTE